MAVSRPVLIGKWSFGMIYVSLADIQTVARSGLNEWGRYCFCVAEGSGGAAVMDRLVFGPTGAMNTVLAV